MLRVQGIQETARANVWIGSPDLDTLKLIMKMGGAETVSKPGEVSIDGYLAYELSIRAVHLFSFASGTSDVKRTTIRYSVDDYNEDSNGRQIGVGMNIEPMSEVGGSVPVDIDIGGPCDHVMNIRVQDLITPLAMGMHMPIFVHQLNAVAKAGGRCFPYFHKMMIPDPDILCNVFLRFFFRSLGKDPVSCAALWAQIRRGLRSLAPTKVGMALSHMFAGINMSATSQCALVLIIDRNVYHGFVLYGDFTTVVRGIAYPPCNAEEITEQLAQLDSSRSSIDKLIGIINAVVNDDGVCKYSWTRENISTSATLVRKFDTLVLSDFDEEQHGRIREVIEGIVYAEEFKRPTSDNIILFLRYVHTGDDTLLRDIPRYIHGGMLQDRGRVARGIAIFGPSAPSMNFGVGKGDLAFTIQMGEDDPNLKEDAEKKRRLAQIPYKMRPSRTAANDWNSLFNTGKFVFPSPRKGKKEFVNTQKVDGSFGGQGMLPIYTLIKSIVAATKKPAAGAKRKAGPEGEQEAPPVKKRTGEANIRAANLLD